MLLNWSSFAIDHRTGTSFSASFAVTLVHRITRSASGSPLATPCANTRLSVAAYADRRVSNGTEPAATAVRTWPWKRRRVIKRVPSRFRGERYTRRRVSGPGVKVSHSRYVWALVAIFAIQWVALAIAPSHRDDWLLENVLTVGAV